MEISEPSNASGRSHKEMFPRESHGADDTINENTPPEDVKGPSICQRIMEELQALFRTLTSQK
jgi:hypothetical protein